ncbi:GPR1/FUN34/yaaH family-domain-containing protein [Radiomyces spectabilis]|uniref:GPR1/FUN34/yaaH family-domain-containing protein n=1 Tax=Radiomyces spectabilis TaxID=64574 RepID=UPI0022206B99|nr:GPR1/FUN34/yaaH family-domain-containing protein [Radiomyces spectabilis]KAI8391289.1 GPR1/FUN34/yaaH family-domain-containing protein [Radiomyces spectabilis]
MSSSPQKPEIQHRELYSDGTSQSSFRHREVFGINIPTEGGYSSEESKESAYGHPQHKHHSPVLGHDLDPAAVQAIRKAANPAAIGFGAFALCAFVLGLYNTGLITGLPQVAVGVALGYGAVGQFISGVGELYLGNTFAGTAMLTYSGFFLSYGVMFTPAGGFLEAAMEAGGLEELNRCVGLYMTGYTIVSFLFFLGTFRQPILIRLVLGQVFLTFLFAALGGYTGNIVLTKIGGWFSFTLALTAWYVMCAIIYDDTTTFIRLPFF